MVPLIYLMKILTIFQWVRKSSAWYFPSMETAVEMSGRVWVENIEGSPTLHGKELLPFLASLNRLVRAFPCTEGAPSAIERLKVWQMPSKQAPRSSPHTFFVKRINRLVGGQFLRQGRSCIYRDQWFQKLHWVFALLSSHRYRSREWDSHQHRRSKILKNTISVDVDKINRQSLVVERVIPIRFRAFLRCRYQRFEASRSP